MKHCDSRERATSADKLPVQSSTGANWPRFDALGKRRGTAAGELIRRLILDELSRDGGEPTASAELSEIVGLRLMLTNVLKPLATGQKITPEVFDGIMTEVKKRKRAVAVEARQEAERA